MRVLFEDRALTPADGAFVDDFRGRALYQRFGGRPLFGYGDAPVGLCTSTKSDDVAGDDARTQRRR